MFSECLRLLLESEIGAETGAQMKARWDQANELKLQANTLVKQGKKEEPLEIYTRAIALAPENFVSCCSHWPFDAAAAVPSHPWSLPQSLFSNRSLCYYNLAKYGPAISDADRCVLTNPWWPKVRHC